MSMGLIVSSWVLQGITAVAAFIIIIIFRNEIRSFLQTKNLWSLLWGLPKKSSETPLKIIGESVFELAESKIGGLIVLPGRENLKEVIHSGIPWGGLVSREMIKSIFWHDNPVHDGAAIIEGNRVLEVGAILPLSHRKDLPSNYGTRHRAAAGLTEITDALVIMVSEESGNVIVSKGTGMHTIKNEDELVQILSEYLGTPAKGDYPQKRFDLIIAAIASVIIIGGVWFSFTKGLDTLITLDVPVEYINRDSNKEIVDTSVNTVSLYLSGSSVLLKGIRSEQVKVRIDLNEAVIGRNEFQIKKENIDLPPRVFLKNIKPPVVTVLLDESIKKDLPVQVDWVGKLPEHLILVSLKLAPERIQIIGGKRILKNISTIYTEKVQLDNIDKSGEITLKPALSPASLIISPDSKKSIRAEYIIKERTR